MILTWGFISSDGGAVRSDSRIEADFTIPLAPSSGRQSTHRDSEVSGRFAGEPPRAGLEKTGVTVRSTSDPLAGARAYTRPETVQEAKALLSRITPYRVWARHQLVGADARAVYLLLPRELGAIIAGQCPDEITVGVKGERGVLASALLIDSSRQ